MLKKETGIERRHLKMKIISEIKKMARKLKKRIIFPEDDDERVRSAVLIIAKQQIAIPILIGESKSIERNLLRDAERLKISKKVISRIKIIDYKSIDYKGLAEHLYEMRKEKGLSTEEAMKLLSDKMYLATMLLKNDDADGIISGAAHPTEHTLRPAFQIIKTKPGISLASGCFLIVHKKGNFIFADCAVNPNPNSEQLADIAISAAEFASQLGIKPKVALLSFSTMGSAKNDMVDKVRNAAAIASQKRPDLVIEGEMQLDAAVVPEVAKRKAPNSRIMGSANVLIFPDLNSGNIGYKLVERFGGASAIGPVIVGLAKPVNDLSRGCSTQDIVDLAAITAIQAGGKK